MHRSPQHHMHGELAYVELDPSIEATQAVSFVRVSHPELLLSSEGGEGGV